MKLPKKLYHGLPTRLLPVVMVEGLKAEASNCIQEAVYLTNDVSVAENYAGMHGEGEWTILAIDTSGIEECNLGPDNYELQELIRDGDTPKLRKYDDWDDVPWHVSLAVCQQVAYLGDIPSSALSVHKHCVEG